MKYCKVEVKLLQGLRGRKGAISQQVPVTDRANWIVVQLLSRQQEERIFSACHKLFLIISGDNRLWLLLIWYKIDFSDDHFLSLFLQLFMMIALFLVFLRVGIQKCLEKAKHFTPFCCNCLMWGTFYCGKKNNLIRRAWLSIESYEPWVLILSKPRSAK